MFMLITGAQCSGKTRIVERLKEKFPSCWFIPEVIGVFTQSGGFPLPGRDLPYSATWQEELLAAVVTAQQSYEAVANLVLADSSVHRHVILDRGLLDYAPFIQGGMIRFSELFGVTPANTFGRYDLVIQLQSLATWKPEFYGRDNNSARIATVERATQIENDLRAIWSGHPKFAFVECTESEDEKFERVYEILSATMT